MGADSGAVVLDRAPRQFADLDLAPEIVAELSRQGLTTCFPIQDATFDDAAAGRDVLGKGRTGSGKTLAFALPLVSRLAAGSSNGHGRRATPRALVLVPTRELANQVRDVIAPLARAVSLRTTVVYGGVGYGKQIGAFRDGVDIVVACPGRMLDHVESGNVDLSRIEVCVLDEADHMAELGFLEDVKRLLDETPEDTQRLLFSATLDRGIDKLVRRYLQDPVVHEVATDDNDGPPASHYFFRVAQDRRLEVIADLCAAPGKSLVFTRTKHGARKLAAALVKAGVPSVELHGDLSQSVRARNLAAFAGRNVDTLVATDIAARGIHVDDVALVIHADPPEEHKAFLHRSGRTARAGATGSVITIVTDATRRHARRLAKDAGIEPEHHDVAPGSEMLTTVAPGEREVREMPDLEERRSAPARGRGNGARSGGARRQGGQGRRDDRRNDRRDDRRDTPRSDDRSDRRNDWRDDRRPTERGDSRPARRDDSRPDRRDDRRPDRGGPTSGAPRRRDDRRDGARSDRRDDRRSNERGPRSDRRSDRPSARGGSTRGN